MNSVVSKDLSPLVRVPQGYYSFRLVDLCGTIWNLNLSTETRRVKLPDRNEKGQCVVKVGPRDKYRTFKFSRSVSDKEVEQRRDRLKEVVEACGGWNDLSNFIAEFVRKGVIPVPLPDKNLSELIGIKYDDWVHWRSVLVKKMPTIPWATLGEASIDSNILLAHSLCAGQMLPLNPPELEVSGLALVTAIDNCPAIATSEGSLVTTRFVNQTVKLNCAGALACISRSLLRLASNCSFEIEASPSMAPDAFVYS